MALGGALGFVLELGRYFMTKITSAVVSSIIDMCKAVTVIGGASARARLEPSPSPSPSSSYPPLLP